MEYFDSFEALLCFRTFNLAVCVNVAIGCGLTLGGACRFSKTKFHVKTIQGEKSQKK